MTVFWCPECENTAEYLLHYSLSESWFASRYNTDGELQIYDYDNSDDDPREEYICPKCKAVVAETKEYADSLIKEDEE